MRTGFVTLLDGGELHYYDATPDATDFLPIIYHHGSPNIGEPPEPLFDAAAERGLRWIGYDRPGYGGSSAQPGRSVGQAAFDAAAVADVLGIERYAVLGHSGGGAHALACAALTPERVVAAVSISGLAPLTARASTGSPGSTRAARPSYAPRPRAVRRCESNSRLANSTATCSRPTTGTRSTATGRGSTASLRSRINRGSTRSWTTTLRALATGASTPRTSTVPTLLVHGTADRVVPASHARWLAEHIDGAELLEVEGASHISVMSAGAMVLDWIAARAAAQG